MIIEPIYSKDKAEVTNKCSCGCGTIIKKGRKFVSGHNLKKVKITEERNLKISKAQKLVWETKRERLPIGEKRISSCGYVLEKVSHSGKKWREEHVLVIEKDIGRDVVRGVEVVHHINIDKKDNQLSNLYLCRDKSHHNKVHDSLIEVAKHMIECGHITFNRLTGKYETLL